MSDSEDESDVLPPVICNNPRKKIESERIDPSTIIRKSFSKRERSRIVAQRSQRRMHGKDSIVKPIGLIIPRFPIAISWSPDRLSFELYDEAIVKNIWIWNCCPRPIYIQCSGLWNDKARLGASWVTGPRTRFYISPGLKCMLFVKATPRLIAPIPGAIISLQLTASHLRDYVKGTYAVPIAVTFLRYVEPHLGEG